MHATSVRDVDGSRRLAVGASDAGDSRRAGAVAARAAVADGGAALLMVFCSALHDPEAVLAGIGSVAGGTPLIGCSPTAVIAPGHCSGESGVVVVAFGGPGFSVTTGISRDVDGRPRDAGIEVGGCVTGLAERPHQALVVLTDGLVTGPEEMVAGAYAVVGASMPMIGGASCPDPAAGRTFQFHGDEIV